jgi:hypothetical protein
MQVQNAPEPVQIKYEDTEDEKEDHVSESSYEEYTEGSDDDDE